MTLRLTDFPVKAGEGIYRAKVRKSVGSRSGVDLYIHHDHVTDCELKEGVTYLARIRRITDAYTEDNVILTLRAEPNDRDHPMRAALPMDTGFASGSKVYVRLTPMDLTSWFNRKNSKGFDVEGEGDDVS